jgi:hypothetical protein
LAHFTLASWPLTYDSNGNAAGGTTVFAQLTAGLALNAGLFTVT